jgi:hypothetical protein
VGHAVVVVVVVVVVVGSSSGSVWDSDVSRHFMKPH